MKLLPAIILLTILSCTKEQLLKENCQPVVLIADKYTLDSVFIKRDTLWNDPRICGHNLDSLTLDTWYLVCPDSTIQHWYYVIGWKQTAPVIFKP